MFQSTCPECGAVISGDRSCQNCFDEFLVLEFTDPGFGQVHFLTVACFMVQHKRYSDDALVWIEQKLRDYFEKGMSAAAIRDQAGREAAQNKRSWKVERRSTEKTLPDVEWKKRITDVKFAEGDAEAYCREITTWARTTLDDMQVFFDQRT